ncbi:hypothetical protein K435DRAFT_798774 [Dendrothele bispora CBS 962.96]|uniref:HAT C-terminal dimerisation domain-containing protein n=1 Tax=Dendrothele bispora (strain CBS 962.96) TaxID=1314807 RepID=A0A4V4HFF3_DENBC|nr:hypothetical protein K435DRAFT_798774 [Dendrothele bispora CBS 962.96]
MQSRAAIIVAQVGATKGTEAQRLEAEAKRASDLIEDSRERPYSFWSGLEAVIGDIEPICYGTNINQKDSTRPDQVLLSIAVKRIEKRWKDCDQPVFLCALILNVWEGLSCFGPNAGLNHFKIANIILWLYRRMNLRPENEDSEKMYKKKRRNKSNQLFICTLLQQGSNPIIAWNAISSTSSDLRELAGFAIMLYKIIVNTAGCERTFSDAKFRQSPRRNRLGLEKLQKYHMVGADIQTENMGTGWNVYRVLNVHGLLGQLSTKKLYSWKHLRMPRRIQYQMMEQLKLIQKRNM